MKRNQFDAQRAQAVAFGASSDPFGNRHGRARIICQEMKTGSMMVALGTRVRLDDFDAAFAGKYKSYAHAKSRLRHNVEWLSKYQDLLYSDHTYALLIVLQAMDGSKWFTHLTVSEIVVDTLRQLD